MFKSKTDPYILAMKNTPKETLTSINNVAFYHNKTLVT